MWSGWRAASPRREVDLPHRVDAGPPDHHLRVTSFILHSLDGQPVPDQGPEQGIGTAAGLERDIEDARRALAQPEVDTRRIVLHEIGGERFVTVPAGALADPPWWVDGRPALKLSKPPRRTRSH